MNRGQTLTLRRTGAPAIEQPQDAISLSTTLSAADMALLRSCNILRQKLLPLLVDLTDDHLAVLTPHTEPWDDIVLEALRNHTGPHIIGLKLSKPFLARITRLKLVGAQLFMPDPSCFKNLEVICLALIQPLFVTGKDVWEDDEKLARACRANIDVCLTSQQLLASELVLTTAREHARWVPQMSEKLKGQDSSGKVHMVVSQLVMKPIPFPTASSLGVLSSILDSMLGKVLHDVTADTVTKELIDKDGNQDRGTNGGNDEDTIENDGEDHGESDNEDNSEDNSEEDSGNGGEE